MDLETTPESFELVIKAEDDGGLSSEISVLINIIDINDNAPVINSPTDKHIFQINENNQVDTEIFQIIASDPDHSASNINYELVEDLNGDWRFFSINNSTGEVKANITFDYEKKKEYSIRIKCSDTGVMILNIEDRDVNAFLINDESLAYDKILSTFYDSKIEVIDIDDNEPEFTKNMITREVSDNSQIGSSIDFIPLAHDADSLPKNTQVRYLIISGNDNGTFSLNEKSGELKLEKELERQLKDTYILGNYRFLLKHYIITTYIDSLLN